MDIILEFLEAPYKAIDKFSYQEKELTFQERDQKGTAGLYFLYQKIL